MSRFFFDVLDGREVRSDPEGQEFVDLPAARAEAVVSAQYLVAHGILRNQDVSARAFMIRSENNQAVATVPFRDTLPGTLGAWLRPLPPARPEFTGRSISPGPCARGTQDSQRLVEERSEARFRTLVEALPAAIYATDADGRITFYNKAAVALAGRRPELGVDRWCVTWRLYQRDGTPLPHDQCPMAIALKENRPIRGAAAVAERPDGTRISFLPFPTPLHDTSGVLVGGVNMLLKTTHQNSADDRVDARC